MKEWTMPVVEELNLEATANIDKVGSNYDGEWAQDQAGQYYLLAQS